MILLYTLLVTYLLLWLNGEHFTRNEVLRVRSRQQLQASKTPLIGGFVRLFI